MRTLALRTLRRFWETGHADAEAPLRLWYRRAVAARWESMQDVRADYPSADLVGTNKLVFNIGGNKYRLICRITFGQPGLYVLWIGTHDQYDRLDVKKL